MKQFLNVGGNNNTIALPSWARAWRGLLLDIDPAGNPDIVGDARELEKLPANSFDAIYCSHNLEHYYHHEVPVVLAGFRHVMTHDAFVHLRVPDIEAVMRTAIEQKLDINDPLYTSSAGPISVRDVIYGYAPYIEQSGNDFYAHRTGFSPKSLLAVLNDQGFTKTYLQTVKLEVEVFAFTENPSEYAINLLKLPT
jgi:SAM-dependent methyltransferase